MTATCIHCQHVIDVPRDTILDGMAEAREMAAFGEAVFQHLAREHTKIMQGVAQDQLMFQSWNLLRHTANPQLAKQLEIWRTTLSALLAPPEAISEAGR